MHAGRGPQAARRCVLVEAGETSKILTNPDDTWTQDTITGRFG